MNIERLTEEAEPCDLCGTEPEFEELRVGIRIYCPECEENEVEASTENLALDEWNNQNS